jgi:hypothetical protein
MKHLGLLFLFLIAKPVLAQDSLLVNSHHKIIIANLDLLSFDNKDNLFVSTTSGDIHQFNPAGKQINLYSPERQGRLQQLEAAWTVNIFSFSSDLQEYRILDRFLNPLSSNRFQFSDISLAKAATLGNNNIIWVWDESDLSLKSLDFLRNIVIQSQPLNLILNADNLEVLEIREFKNRLFMNVANEGIFIFDNQGNFLKRLEILTDQRLCFFKENLLWIQDHHIMAYSMVTQTIQKSAPLPFKAYRYLQLGQESLALVGKDKIDVYPLPNWFKTLR